MNSNETIYSNRPLNLHTTLSLILGFCILITVLFTTSLQTTKANITPTFQAYCTTIAVSSVLLFLTGEQNIVSETFAIRDISPTLYKGIN